MLPPGLSAEEAAASQQRPPINGTSFNKDPLSSALSSSSFPHTKSSRSSTLSSAEENLLTIPADAASSASPPTGASHRLSGERKFGQALHSVNGEPVSGTSCPAVERQAQQQQGGAAALASASGDPGETIAPDCLQACSRMASEARTVTPPLVATFGSSAASDGFSTATKEPSGGTSQACRTAPLCPPSLQCNLPSVTLPGERNGDTSPSDGGTGTAGGLLRAAAPRLTGPPSVSSFPDKFHPAAAAHPKDAPARAAQPGAAEALVEEELHHSASADKTETCSRRDRAEELHAAEAVSPALASPREQKAGGPRRGRIVKEDNAVEVITRVDVAVEALVAHAEEQAEQIKRLTMLVEDLSLKLEGLQERLISGRISVHLAPPAAAELPPAAGATEVRQSRGRMVPPPLPRDKIREPYLGAADQQGLPPFLRHGNSAASGELMVVLCFTGRLRCFSSDDENLHVVLTPPSSPSTACDARHEAYRRTDATFLPSLYLERETVTLHQVTEAQEQPEGYYVRQLLVSPVLQVSLVSLINFTQLLLLIQKTRLLELRSQGLLKHWLRKSYTIAPQQTRQKHAVVGTEQRSCMQQKQLVQR
eukprot:XP_028351537.1 uncharacterized protein LOC114487123 [Physeter catodon]